MSINQRIRDLINAKGHNPNSFSGEVGLQPQTLHHIIAGRLTKPSFEVLEKIVSTYSDINLRWLITGEGEMLLKEAAKPEAHNGKTLPQYDNNHIRETLKYIREELERQHAQIVKTTAATEDHEKRHEKIEGKLPG